MIGQLKSLFSRYSAQHLFLKSPDMNMPLIRGGDAGESAAAHVHQIVLKNNHLQISGTAHSGQITAENSVARRVEYPQALSPDAVPRFRLRLPFDRGETRIANGQGQDAAFTVLPQFSKTQIFWGQLRLVPGFLWSLLCAVPAALRWFRHKDPTARTEVRNILGLAPLTDALKLDETLFQVTDNQEHPVPSVRETPAFVIVMPVFNAFDVLQDALGRIERHTRFPWKMVLIEDCSTDPQVAPFLRDWSARQGAHVTLLENAQNLGFIGSVNRGFAQALKLLQDETEDSRASVVLLNSDALVPNGWVERLLLPLAEDPAIASVTPMSNDAELLTVPTLCACHSLGSGVADQIDHIVADLPIGPYLRNVQQGAADMPTGVGFCMAMGLQFLRRVPEFDRVFGAGYGEEVDWCQKAIERGGRHVAQPRLFVEHRGGASFGSEEKKRLLVQNGALISQRYPKFDQQVQDFIADDPLLSARVLIGLAWIAAEAKAKGASTVPVYLGHSLGGGAEMDLMRRVAQNIARQGAAVVLRVGGATRWQIELHSSSGVTRGATEDTGFLAKLLSVLPTRRLIYSCGVGDPDAAGLPDAILKLGQGASGGYEVLFHDFLPLSPSYTLLDADGSWHGVAQPGNTDRAHKTRRPDGSQVDLAPWRFAWGDLLTAANRIEVFSQNSRQLVAEAYPDIASHTKGPIN